MSALCDFSRFVRVAADEFSVKEKVALYAIVVANGKNRVKAVGIFIRVKDQRGLPCHRQSGGAAGNQRLRRNFVVERADVNCVFKKRVSSCSAKNAVIGVLQIGLPVRKVFLPPQAGTFVKNEFVLVNAVGQNYLAVGVPPSLFGAGREQSFACIVCQRKAGHVALAAKNQAAVVAPDKRNDFFSLKLMVERKIAGGINVGVLAGRDGDIHFVRADGNSVVRVLDKNAAGHPSACADCVYGGTLASASDFGKLGAKNGLAHVGPKNVKLQRRCVHLGKRARIQNSQKGSAFLLGAFFIVGNHLVALDQYKFRSVLVDPKAVGHAVKPLRQAADDFSDLDKVAVKAQSKKFPYVNLKDQVL